jgi:hypothetical protein
MVIPFEVHNEPSPLKYENGVSFLTIDPKQNITM